MNATLKDNVVFGETFDEEKYANVIEAAALGYARVIVLLSIATIIRATKTVTLHDT